MDLKNRISETRGRIAMAATKSGRRPEQVTLLAVTKNFPVLTLQEAYDLGLRQFGENRVQEALKKIGELPHDIQWHLIGRLQSNKINKILGKFVLVHSVDSLELAQALSQRLQGKQQEILLEVNTSGEASKAGVEVSDAPQVAEKIASLPGLRLKGLMTIGPLTEDKVQQRDAFKRLKGLFDQIQAKPFGGENFDVLSMGMSGDYEAAIEEGSTMVRIGTALFGPRA